MDIGRGMEGDRTLLAKEDIYVSMRKGPEKTGSWRGGGKVRDTSAKVTGDLCVFASHAVPIPGVQSPSGKGNNDGCRNDGDHVHALNSTSFYLQVQMNWSKQVSSRPYFCSP